LRVDAKRTRWAIILLDVLTETFRLALMQYRARGGRLYRLANDHDISPSVFSATVTGARRCGWDPRIVAIGATLGLKPEDVFVDDTEVASQSSDERAL
jgi:hypothetical protein